MWFNMKVCVYVGVCVLQILTSLRSIRLDEDYRKVENLSEKLENLKQRFGLGSVERLVHSAHLEMEQVGCSSLSAAAAVK